MVIKKLSDSGQLFTIECLTSAIIMLVSAYIVLGSGMILTPGDVHISDMQLKQLGNDALLMMDTKDTYNGVVPLASIIQNASPCMGSVKNQQAESEFKTQFENYLSMNTGSAFLVESLKFNSTIYYMDGDSLTQIPFAESENAYGEKEGDNPGRSPAIRCGRYVGTEWMSSDTIVRLEVLIWRD